MRKVQSIIDLIGNTPLVRLNYFSSDKVSIWAKLECYNPGGSVKDRPAFYMIEGAERRGELTKDKIIIEATSGNTGIGLAMVARVKGYKVKIVMPESVSLERRSILKAFGAELVLSPGDKGTDGAIELAFEIYNKEPDRYYMPNQFDNPDNMKAHYETTGPEIYTQLEGDISAFVAGIGTSGTLMGAGRFLRERVKGIKIFAVEPFPGHSIQGLKSLEEARVPKIFNPDFPDDIIKVSDEEAFNLAKLIPEKEGIFAGLSSGAALYGALAVRDRIESGNIVVVFPDSGERYLSVGVFPP